MQNTCINCSLKGQETSSFGSLSYLKVGLKFIHIFRWSFSPGSLDFPGGSDSKASAYNVGDLGLIPRLGRSPGEGNSNPLQDSCLENPMDGGSWYTTIHEVAKSWTRLSDFTFFSLLHIKFKNHLLQEAVHGHPVCNALGLIHLSFASQDFLL